MLCLTLLGLAWGIRPDEGGSYSYDSTDVLEWVDGPLGFIRVHYSVEGPNVTRLTDADKSGYPDFAEEVAVTAEEVLDFYESLGFLLPITESEMGLSPLGGSDALDIYLVDFAGVADGWFSYDACSGSVCSGFMAIENDFVGYGYPSLTEAIRVLTSHELFHGVQAAYNADQPVWMSEGTAVWAEHQFDSDVDDFYWFCDAYLEDAGRSLDRPPSGSVTAFSYGTALFFQFLTERMGTDVVLELQSLLYEEGASDPVGLISDAIAQYGSTLEAEWEIFSRWNLATGWRSGIAEGYPFADRLNGILAEAEGSSIQDDNRFYPLATTYFRVEHAGGDLVFSSLEDPSGLVFSLHRVADEEDDGPVEDPVEVWAPLGPETRTWSNLSAGGYWLVGTYPQIADQSVKIEFCLGGLEDVGPCVDQVEDTDEEPLEDSSDGGCSCQTASPVAGIWFLAWLGVFWRRRDDEKLSLNF